MKCISLTYALCVGINLHSNKVNCARNYELTHFMFSWIRLVESQGTGGHFYLSLNMSINQAADHKHLEKPYIKRQELLEASQIFILKQVLGQPSSDSGLSADITHLFNAKTPFKQKPAPHNSSQQSSLIFKEEKCR